MGNTWTYQYGSNTIVVKNYINTELYVNGELQDRKTGLMVNGELSGKLNTGEEIKVSLGGFFKVECSLFVNNSLITPTSIE